MDIATKSFEEDMLKLLKSSHYYSFLENDGGENPQAFRSW